MSRFSEIDIPAEVVAAARCGDPRALEAIYVATAGPVMTLLGRLVRRRAVAEELLQETFIDVLQHIGDFAGRCPLPAWIRTLALNRALMYLRSPWYRAVDRLGSEVLADEAADPDHHAGSGDRALERALMRLPAHTRAVVWLHDVEGYTHAEIAALLGRTPSFSKSQLARAHLRLRGLLAPEIAIPGGEPCRPV
ncbi:MAG: RNA polymerase sigma factor [Gammaproteobacteria bacterium]|nr:MAG: RNA polymerase sigma factor [Gammaproteobacteria bacterium]